MVTTRWKYTIQEVAKRHILRICSKAASWTNRRPLFVIGQTRMIVLGQKCMLYTQKRIKNSLGKSVETRWWNRVESTMPYTYTTCLPLCHRSFASDKSTRLRVLPLTYSSLFTFSLPLYLSPDFAHPVAQVSSYSPDASAEINARMLVISCRVEVALRAGEEQGQLQEVLPEAEGGPSAL